LDRERFCLRRIGEGLGIIGKGDAPSRGHVSCENTGVLSKWMEQIGRRGWRIRGEMKE